MDATVSKQIEAFAAKKKFKDVASLKAVAFVESAGVFFWIIDGTHRPALRFEGHYFDRILRSEHPHLLPKARAEGLANPTAGAVRNPNAWRARYELFERACKINRDAAIRSCSWGIGQVMGDHWKTLGFTSAANLMDVAHNGVDGQLELMWRFIEKNGLKDALIKRDWATFARKYNGPAYKKNAYDTKMAQAYARFNKSPSNGHMFLIQDKLKSLGLYTGKVDGIFGPKTLDAVVAFQDAAGLVVDGQPGSVTIEALDRFMAEKASAKSRNNIPALAGGAALVSGTIPQIIDAIDTAQEVGDKAKGLLEVLSLSSVATTAIVAVVVVVVVGSMIRKVRSDNAAQTLGEALG